MTKSIFLPAFIVTLILFSQSAAYGQSSGKSDEAEPSQRFDIAKSTATSKTSALANMAMTRLGDQTGQTRPTSQTKPGSTSGYVFPTAEERFHRYVKNTVG